MEKKKSNFNLGFLIGMIGLLAGVLLIVQGNYLIGLSGSVASVALALMNLKKFKQD